MKITLLIFFLCKKLFSLFLSFHLYSYIFQALLEASRDIIADWLDGLHGSEVTDNSIFASLPKHFEEQFHQDMKALNVKMTLEDIHCRPEMLFS